MTDDTVSFTQMKDGTTEDYALLHELEKPHLAGTAERLLRALAAQADEALPGYKITRLEHALQAATKARRDGADDDWICAALLHDIGDGLAPQNHDRFAAEILRPFLREECVWVVEHHGTFQMYYYAHHYGWNQNEREKYKDSCHYQTCVDFCERWDQSSFDPAYQADQLESFTTVIEGVFQRKAYDPAITRPGVSQGLPVLQS
jgi:predicted HD phosphohydrolase